MTEPEEFSEERREEWPDDTTDELFHRFDYSELGWPFTPETP